MNTQYSSICYNNTTCAFLPVQHAKKVVSDSLGLVDFAIRLVNPVLKSK